MKFVTGTAAAALLAIAAYGCGTTQPTSGDSKLLEGELPPSEDSTSTEEGGGSEISSTGAVPEGCVKLENAQIGKAPLTVTLSGGQTVTITSWTEKADSHGEYVGFTTSAGASFAVKAGGETYQGSGDTWAHPDGDSGSEASAISNVTFCPGDDGEEMSPCSDGRPTCGGTCCAEGLQCIDAACVIPNPL